MSVKDYGAITGGRIMEAYYDEAHLSNLVYEALDFGLESIQVFPNQIEKVRALLRGKEHRFGICAVIAYPHGTFLPEQKAEEIEDAAARGADQLEVVLNVVNVRSGEWELVRREFSMSRQAAGKRTLKCIVEAEYLTDSMLQNVCALAAEAGIDRLGTSIGVYPLTHAGKEFIAGADPETVQKMKAYCQGKTAVTAMGNIDTAEKFEALLRAGADYICTEHAAAILRKLAGGNSDV